MTFKITDFTIAYAPLKSTFLILLYTALTQQCKYKEKTRLIRHILTPRTERLRSPQTFMQSPSEGPIIGNVCLACTCRNIGL